MQFWDAIRKEGAVKSSDMFERHHILQTEIYKAHEMLDGFAA